MTLTLDDLRLVGAWAADCAERVLPLFEDAAPTDLRPRGALAGIRGFAAGGRRTAALRSQAMAAHAAARDVDDPAATAAARAAGLAAAVAYTHPLRTLDQGRHLLGPAVYAARAHELAAGEDPAAGEAELHWAIEHTSPEVREVVGRWPPRDPGRSRLDRLYHRLDAALRD
jgi:hypothetical protein